MFKTKFCAVLAVAGAIAAPAAASPVNGILTPLIVAGNLTNIDGPGTADSPAQRVDPNVPTSPYSGVVSINTRYNGLSYICTGTLIDSTHVLTAGHCVDTTGQGNTINLNIPGNDVRAVFNATSSGTGSNVITASRVVMHPDYAGFGVCPVGVNSFCVNDDIAVIELSTPAPLNAQIYAVHQGVVAEGTTFTMVGYGLSGDGVNGYTVSPSFRVKRSGQNVYDLYDNNDEANFSGASAKEVWYADFDGNDGTTVHDAFCTELSQPVCGASLGNRIETNLGGGDSGGPSFIMANGRLELVANNTFGGTFSEDQIDGSFGTYMGGILLSSYQSFIDAAVPEPGMIGLFGLGVLGLTVRRRKTA